MRCRVCDVDYEPEAASCGGCGGMGVSGPEQTSARLGRFHPAVAPAVVELAIRRGAPVETTTVDGTVEVLVPSERRDGLRAELLLSWDDLLTRLSPHDQVEVEAQGGQLPGWDDKPDGVWVDRDGQLRVARAQEEEAEEERIVGPAIVAIAVVLLLLAWQLGDGHLRLLLAVVGFGLLLIGIFLPG